MSAHLDENQLLEASLGLLADDPALEAHLDACGECRSALAQVMRSPIDPTSRAHDLATFPLANPDHFLLAEEFARGGMGRIRLARDLRLGRVVALKEMLVDAPSARARFEREARITAQLQHPSIVPVHEAGLWPSGERFFVMTRVEGRSLDAVVDEAKTLDARLALLPNLLAVADAMAFAHARGVIHRDLKPRNVLVGVYGETVVIDWGLAKDLSIDTAEPALRPMATAGLGSGETTAAGEIFGTPVYMPREQAFGLPVDARADVYAIGAMLYHVLSGRMPYADSSPSRILQDVRTGPPVPLSRLEPRVPPELLTLVDRAMAREAADRYPSARELAEDLRRYQTGRLVGAHQYSLGQLARRWLARHRAPVTVGALSLVLLAVLGVVSLRRIIQAEQLAEDRRERAEDLIGFMVGDLHAKLRPIGRLDALEPVARKAVAYYDVQPAQGLGPSEQIKQTQAQRNLGDVLLSLGELSQALEAYRKALAVNEQLVAKHPENLAYLGQVSLSHGQLAAALVVRGDWAEGIKEFEAALAIDELRLRRAPGSLDCKRSVAVSLGRLGKALAQHGLYPESEARLLPSLVLFEELSLADPSNPERRVDLGRAQLNVARGLYFRGDVAGAATRARSAQAIFQALADSDPKNVEWQSFLSATHTELGDALQELNDLTGALAAYRAGMTIDERLSARDPTNALLLRDVTVGHLRIAAVLQLQRDVQGTLTEYRAALANARSLEAIDPTDQTNLADLRTVHSGLGEQLFLQDDNEGALAAFRAALAIAERLLAKDPTNATLQVRVFNGHGRIGKVLASLGDLKGAIEETEVMREGHAALVAKDPGIFDWQFGLSFSHGQLGDLYYLQRDFPSALSHFRERLAIVEALSREFPDRLDVQDSLAGAHSAMADVLFEQGRPKDAVPIYRLSIEKGERLSAAATNVQFQEAMAWRQEHLANALWASKEFALARVEFAAALKRLLPLLAIAPEDKGLRRGIARLEASMQKLSLTQGK